METKVRRISKPKYPNAPLGIKCLVGFAVSSDAVNRCRKNATYISPYRRSLTPKLISTCIAPLEELSLELWIEACKQSGQLRMEKLA